VLLGLRQKRLRLFASIRKRLVGILADVGADALTPADNKPGLSIFSYSDRKSERRIVVVLARSYC
jgi:hypothetical protein